MFRNRVCYGNVFPLSVILSARRGWLFLVLSAHANVYLIFAVTEVVMSK